MPYSPSYWQNSPTTTTPLSAAQLNALEARAGVNAEVLSANPGAETDWGPIFKTAMDNGAKVISLADRVYPITTTTGVFTARTGVVFRGAAGLNWPDHGPGSNVSTLRWKGTGAGRAFDCRSSDGLTFCDLALDYDSSSYTGDLIDLGQSGATPSAYVTFDRCRIGAASIKTARCLFRLDSSVMPIIRQCGLRGAQTAIRGVESGGAAFAGNDAVIEDCVFTACVTFLMNIGLYWRIRNPTFEFTDTATVAAIDSDFTVPSTAGSVFWLENATWWDPAAPSTQIPLRQKVGNTMQVCVRGGKVEAGFTQICLQFNGPGDVVVDGTQFARVVSPSNNELIDLGTSGASAQKSLVDVRGVSFFTSDATGSKAIKNVDGGHKVVNIHPNAAGGQREVETRLGQIKLGYHTESANLPTIATHAGQTNIGVCEIFGNDQSGVIFIRTSGGSSVAGSVLDVTFAQALIDGVGGGGFGGGTNRVPRVLVAPAHDAGGSALAADYYAAQVYAKVTSSNTGFEVGTVNAIPTSKTIAVAYDVVNM